MVKYIASTPAVGWSLWRVVKASNSDDVKPALTAEEWARGPGVFGWDDGSVFIAHRDEQPSVERPHAVAAVLLHGQPFGFTREDVRMLRECAKQQRDIELDSEAIAYAGSLEYGAELDALADRIAALLPPEPTDG